MKSTEAQKWLNKTKSKQICDSQPKKQTRKKLKIEVYVFVKSLAHNGKFIIVSWRYRILGANGKAVARSVHSYTRKSDCIRAAKRIPNASVEVV